jgi:hypothetical protein
LDTSDQCLNREYRTEYPMLLEVMKMKYATATHQTVFFSENVEYPQTAKKNWEDDLEDAVLDPQTWWFSTWFSSYPFNFRTNKKNIYISQI